jgi:hypothetical protein
MDFNLSNYQKNELQEMFQLPSDYNQELVDIQEKKLRDNIVNNPSIDENIKNKTLFFLQEAKHLLLTDVANFYNTRFDLKQTPINNDNNHDVQERKPTPFLNSFPSEFFPGVINPLKKRVSTQNLNIDTRFRDNYYSSPSTNYQLNLPIKMSSVMTMQLSAFEMPTTFYNVSKQYGNNFMSISITDSTNPSMPITTSAVLTIQDGNYTYDTITSYLNSILTNLGDPFDNLIFVVNLMNTSGSGQMVVGFKTLPDIANFEFSLNFQADKNGEEDKSTPLPLKLGWTLGFRNGIYINNSTYVSEGVVDLLGPRYIYLVVDDYNNNVNNNFYSAFTSSILNNNILARISMNANFFDILGQNNLSLITTPREYYGPVDIQKMNVQLLDEYGRVLDLNNMDYSFCLTFKSVYDI